MSEVLSGQLAYNPSTSVRIRSRSAPRATARAPAAVSALMLYTSPSSKPGAMVETTGMRPASMMSMRLLASTFTISPTRPMSVSFPSTSTRRFSA